MARRRHQQHRGTTVTRRIAPTKRDITTPIVLVEVDHKPSKRHVAGIREDTGGVTFTFPPDTEPPSAA